MHRRRDLARLRLLPFVRLFTNREQTVEPELAFAVYREEESPK